MGYVASRSVLLAFACFAALAAAAGPSTAEQGQERSNPSAKDTPGAVQDPARRAQLQRELAEIERRIREHDSDKVYLTPRSNLTPEMREFFARLVRKIEDCGTRHLPKRDSKTAYGKGVMGVTLDRLGKVIDAEILESSRDKMVDAHMRKVIWSSSPFGRLPAKLTEDRSKPYKAVFLVSSFEFKSDDKPLSLLPDDEACKWKH